MAENLKLSLEIKRKDTNEHVSHKIGGQRFGHTNTVKLNVNIVYDARVTLHTTVLFMLKQRIRKRSQ